MKPADVTIDVRAASSAAGLESDYIRHQLTLFSGRAYSWFFRSELIEVVAKGDAKLRLRRNRNQLTHDSLGLPELESTASAMLPARQFRIMAKNAALRAVRRLQLDVEKMRELQGNTESTVLLESGANIAAAYRSLPDDAQEFVLLAMQKIIPGLTSILVEPLDEYLQLKFKQKQRGGEEATFRAAAMSEGALRALGILVAAQQITKDELLIIEEPEVAIHVGAAQLLFNVLKRASRRGAVLVTTHSADLLDAAQDEEILVCSYRDGVTKIGPLASSQRKIVKQGLFSLGEIMRAEPLRIEGEPIPAVGP
jgi:type I restriction enzyme M protein